MKANEMKCRVCGATVFDCGGWLERVNEKGVPGVYECRPMCGADMPVEEKILGAIEGCEAEEQRGEGGE
jgi:hypothetical protein